jgi:hypothetical protein
MAQIAAHGFPFQMLCDLALPDFAARSRSNDRLLATADTVADQEHGFRRMQYQRLVDFL